MYTPTPSELAAMRSPWVDLLFLHGHITPSNLSWHVDAPAPACATEPAKVEVDVTKLPLPSNAQTQDTHTRCA